MESKEIRILNYEFSFCLFFFLPVWIFICTAARVLPFRQRDCRDVFVRRSVTCGYEGYCLSGKGSLIVEGRRHIVFQNVFGLKSRIFTRNCKFPITNFVLFI